MIPQIQIPVADLKRELQGLSKFIQKQSTIPVLACVSMECTDEGFRITDTNLNLIRTINTEPAAGLFKMAVRAVALQDCERLLC